MHVGHQEKKSHLSTLWVNSRVDHIILFRSFFVDSIFFGKFGCMLIFSLVGQPKQSDGHPTVGCFCWQLGMEYLTFAV